VNKKGVSPLIATILLIGATIVIASLLIVWWGGSIKDTVMKESVVNTGKQMCAGGVSIDVVSCNAGSVTVMNTGTEPVTAFRFRVGDETITREDEIRPSKQKTMEVDGAGSGLSVIPVIVVEGYPITCSEKLVEVASC